MKIKSKKAILYLSLLIFFLVTLHASAAFSTIYDVNKYWNDNIPLGVDPEDTSDSLMCWAATASNVLRYTGWGVDSNNDGSVHHRLDMYHEFLAAFPNDGGSGSLAYESYFNWHYPGTDIVEDGLFEQVYHNRFEPKKIINSLDSLLEENYGIYLSITETGWSGHAITVWDHFTMSWGDQELHYITITDSDDGTAEEVKTYPIIMDDRFSTLEAPRWYLHDYYGKNSYYMRRLDALAPRFQQLDPTQPPIFQPQEIVFQPQFTEPAYNLHYQLQDIPDGPGTPVPEPTTMLLLGAGLIGMAGFGRKRFFKKD